MWRQAQACMHARMHACMGVCMWPYEKSVHVFGGQTSTCFRLMLNTCVYMRIYACFRASICSDDELIQTEIQQQMPECFLLCVFDHASAPAHAVTKY